MTRRLKFICKKLKALLFMERSGCDIKHVVLLAFAAREISLAYRIDEKGFGKNKHKKKHPTSARRVLL